MAKQYKTPGVYVVEKNSFGSSIVANATAIPVFIGLTEYANNSKDEPLNKVKGSSIVIEPVLVRSMLEYQNAFGGTDETGRIYVTESDKDGNTVYSAQNKNQDGTQDYEPGLMHPALSNFFSNGGGSCYIISLGKYEDFKQDLASTISSEMNFVQKAIEMAETATLIVLADLIRFGAKNYYSWGTQLINFCEQEKKYFTIMDVIQVEPNNPVLNTNDISNYRVSVSPDFPSYAGAYFPYLKSLTPYAFKSDLSNVYLDGSPLFIGKPSTNRYVATIGVKGAEVAICVVHYSDLELFPAITYEAASGNAASITVNENKLAIYYTKDASVGEMNALWKRIEDIHPKWTLEFFSPTVEEDAVINYGEFALWKNVQPSDEFPFIASCKLLTVTNGPINPMKATIALGPENSETAVSIVDGGELTITVAKDSSVKEAIANFHQGAANVMLEANPLYLSDKITGGEKVDMPKNNNSSATIDNVKTFLSTNYINMPPSPFMAGIYCRLDNATGVWTPPANVAPTGVTGPVVPLTNKQQETLNVDATAGKSINAIRSFTGMGTLVWGARTNDGNSMDWRYINVRRLFISMETDISAALEAYVFKPNVHNTWVEVKTMIESYLFGLYGQGAFAGSTPATSYQVLIGKGETMTDEDILNGYMRVSIQVAPVRPAEFIVLTFTQMVGQ